MRTETQRDADHIDCRLYSVICGVETLYSKAEGRRDRDEMKVLRDALIALRAARPHIRSLMREEDRKATS